MSLEGARKWGEGMREEEGRRDALSHTVGCRVQPGSKQENMFEKSTIVN